MSTAPQPTRFQPPSPYMSVEDRARYAIDNPDVAHAPGDLREILAGLIQVVESMRLTIQREAMHMGGADARR